MQARRCNDPMQRGVMMADVQDFIRAVFRYWIVLLTGGIMMAAVGVVEHFPGQATS